jgi:hypothetical protein
MENIKNLIMQKVYSLNKQTHLETISRFYNLEKIMFSKKTDGNDRYVKFHSPI